MSLGCPRIQMPRMAPSTPKGMPSSTANGTDQLSYWAASTRNTITSPMANTRAASPVDACSWYDCPEYATPTPCDANWPATSVSISSSNSPELNPALGVPVKSADSNPLNRETTVGPARNC